MLFGNFSPSVDSPDPLRLALLDAILLDFQAAFPDLHFELRLDLRVVNAQAILLDDRRCVLVYGGLALHPSLADSSLTFVFLHEAGHHLGVGPRLPYNVTLACDCIADHWAATIGAQILHQRSGREFQMGQALIELDCLMQELKAADAFSQDRGQSCWNRQWSHRRKTLGVPRQVPTRCDLMLKA